MIKKFFRDNPVHKKIVPFLDYFFLLRPTYFFNVWIAFLSGMYVVQLSYSREEIWGVDISLNSLFLILGLTIFSSGCFINWQLKSNLKFRLQNKISLFDSKISIASGKILQTICIALGTTIVIITDFTLTPILFLLIFFTTSILSSNDGENQLKELMIFSILLFLSGIVHNFFILAEVFQFQSIKNMIPFLFLIIIISSTHQISKDKKYQKYLFQHIILTFLCIVTIFLGLLNNDPISATASITIVPFIFMLIIRNNEIDQLRAVRYSILIMCLFILSTYPQFIWYSVFIYFISKYYYWHRFNFHYPKLVIENDRNFTK
ncbi:MAG: hypothetical protein CMF96_04265 [Candidatus Marinimicrobia bacterium]|nr:hypothetical protein [Candidatus Neomarinimicrobiota bacterium]